MATIQHDLPANLRGFSWLAKGPPKSRGGSRPSLHLPLYVDSKAKLALTPFRLHAIRLIQAAADYPLGLPICHAGVFIQPSPSGANGWFLLLNLTCVADDTELPKIRQAISRAVEDAAAGWTAEERRDYGEHIHFEVETSTSVKSDEAGLSGEGTGIGSRRATIEYDNMARIEALLTSDGTLGLQEVLQLILGVAETHRWPLVKIDVSVEEDADVAGWVYVLVSPTFDSDFETGDHYLKSLYPDIDRLVETLPAVTQRLVKSKVFFDIVTQ